MTYSVLKVPLTPTNQPCPASLPLRHAKEFHQTLALYHLKLK